MTTSKPLKVLVVLYYWPPAGGPGVQRWLKFVKYLKDFNIKPTVIAPENPNYPILDESLKIDIPFQQEVITLPIIEPYKIASAFSENDTNTLSKGIIKENSKQSLLQKAMLYTRGNLFIPDARVLWIKPSVKRLSKLLIDNTYDAIITTGPPHSLHRIGYHLKKKYPKLCWIADFRDPWTTIGYHSQLKLSEFSKNKHLKLEKEVLNTADSIIVTSPKTKQEFEGKTNKPVHLITNGYDVTEIEAELDENFSLAHVGTLLSERNPEVLWEVLSELINEDEIFKSHLELKFVGQVSQAIIDSIEQYNLKIHSRFLGYLPHEQAQQEMFNSQVLLLIEKNKKETQGIIPGKLFEYLQSQRPILGIGPEDWDVTSLLKIHNSGTSFTYNQEEDIKQCILSYYNDYLKGKLVTHQVGIQAYHRKQLTGRLAQVIQQTLNQNA